MIKMISFPFSHTLIYLHQGNRFVLIGAMTRQPECHIKIASSRKINK